MTQPAVIPALLELCCLLLSLPGVMWETDLAKSPAAARCEMDSGTALGRQSQARHLLGPLQTQHIPCAPQPRGAQLSQLPSLSQGPASTATGAQALGHSGSAQTEGHFTAAQLLHNIF